MGGWWGALVVVVDINFSVQLWAKLNITNILFFGEKRRSVKLLSQDATRDKLIAHLYSRPMHL